MDKKEKRLLKKLKLTGDVTNAEAIYLERAWEKRAEKKRLWWM